MYLLHETMGGGTPAVRHLKLTVRPTSISIAFIGGIVMLAGTIHTYTHEKVQEVK